MVKVACIQPDAKDLKNYRQAMERIFEMVDEAGTKGTDLIVIPECVFPAYYIGLDEEVLNHAFNEAEQMMIKVAEKAKKYNTYITIGVIEKEGEQLYNSALLFDRNGREVAKSRKVYMWHFDSVYFTPGEDFILVDTDIGKLGLIICCDGRMPEITRCLALRGAEIIVDLANLTSTGKDQTTLTNAQCGYMLSIRALENKVWLVMADKCGLEARTVLNAGRSCVIDPYGNVVREASPYQEEIIYADIDPSLAKDKSLLDTFNLNNRRTDTYQALTQPLETLPAYHYLSKPVIPSQMVVQCGVTSFDTRCEQEILEKTLKYVQTLEDQLANLIVIPFFIDIVFDEIETRVFIQNIQSVLVSPETIVVVTLLEGGQKRYKASYLFNQKSILGKYIKTHLETSEEDHLIPGEEYPVFETSKGNIGIMHDIEGLIPEVPRILVLNGADLIIWINDFPAELQERVARTRAAESKVFIAAVNRLKVEDETFSMIADPNGAVIASTLKGKEQAAAVQVPLLLSRCKVIVPGTDALADRKPSQYMELIK
jgi:predicted amidohydrolase